jgi:hypothetical protein
LLTLVDIFQKDLDVVLEYVNVTETVLDKLWPNQLA